MQAITIKLFFFFFIYISWRQDTYQISTIHSSTNVNRMHRENRLPAWFLLWCCLASCPLCILYSKINIIFCLFRKDKMITRILNGENILTNWVPSKKLRSIQFFFGPAKKFYFHKYLKGYIENVKEASHLEQRLPKIVDTKG